jgi:DNA-directed RNA polymerase subunit omega
MNLPQGIDSKYRFILVAAKRARQLQAGAKPLIQTSTKRPTRIAMMELEAGVLPFEGPAADFEQQNPQQA